MVPYSARNKDWLNPYSNFILTHLTVIRICTVLEAIHFQFEGLARHYKMEREFPAKIVALKNSKR